MIGRMASGRGLRLLAGLCLLGWPSAAQVSLDLRARAALPRTAPSEVYLRIDEALVLVPVTVSDARDRLVTGLEKDRFRVFDDKVEQTVTHFAMEDAPQAVGLVFDNSASMGKKLRRSRAAAARDRSVPASRQYSRKDDPFASACSAPGLRSTAMVK